MLNMLILDCFQNQTQIYYKYYCVVVMFKCNLQSAENHYTTDWTNNSVTLF